jgi:hypothetical protein
MFHQIVLALLPAAVFGLPQWNGPATAGPGPAHAPGLNSFYYGCYTEGTQSRALTGAATFNFTTMTPQVCESFCYAQKLPIWGVEYGGECYCGDHLTVGAWQSFASQCAVKCPGNNALSCGGGGYLNLYGASPNPPVETSANGKNVTAPVYVGCRTEGNGKRALSGASVADGTSMTSAACGRFCLNRGFLVFGTEYSSECYCGNALEPSSAVAPAGECGMKCSGDATEMCGGPNRLSVYQWQ